MFGKHVRSKVVSYDKTKKNGDAKDIGKAGAALIFMGTAPAFLSGRQNQ